jgi:hypothetical protein
MTAQRVTTMAIKTLVLACGLIIRAPSLLFAQPDAACKALQDGLDIKIGDFAQRQKPVCRIDQGCLEVDWNVATKQQLTETLGTFRFTEKTPLKVQTTNFNFLQYTVKWSQTVEREDKAFEAVSSLFEKVFPVLEILGLARTGDKNALTRVKQDAFTRWVEPLELASLCLSNTVADYTALVVDKAGTSRRERLYYVHELLEQTIPVLATRRLDFLKSAQIDITSIETYWKISERHTDFEHRVTEFLPLAEVTYNGLITTVGSSRRNTHLIVNGQAARRSSGEPIGEALTPRYFVAWSRPLTYHVGYGYGRIRDIEFNQVRALSGQDVFTATQPGDDAAAGNQADTKAGPEAVAFMTLELLSYGPNARYGAGLTLGTGLNSPGESLYAGATFRVFSRILLTGGAVWARATRGEKPLIDEVVGAEPRRAFLELTENTEIKGFFSISFKVY